MTKVQMFAVAVVAVDFASVAYSREYGRIAQEEDFCPCCVESSHPWLEDYALLEGDINAALLCSEPLWMELAERDLPEADPAHLAGLLALGEPRELYRREEWALEDFRNRAA